MTRYLVLKRHGEEDAWSPIGAERVEASSARAAILGALNHRSDADGEFVAIPERSWQPLRVATETVTRVKAGP